MIYLYAQLLRKNDLLIVGTSEGKISMNNVYDIQQYLKSFSTFIYTKDRIGDLHLMEAELVELHQAGILPIRDYQVARHILRAEEIRLKQEKQKE